MYRGAWRNPVGKPEGKRTLGRPRHKWGDIIKILLGEIGWGGIEWIDVSQGRGHWRVPCDHGNKALGSLNCLRYS
jgi:hypothetical protein